MPHEKLQHGHYLADCGSSISMAGRLERQQIGYEAYRKTGVVIFLFNREGEVLLLRETFSEQETRKEAGQYGVVCETSEPGEGWEHTVMRGFAEELGINPSKHQGVLKVAASSFLGETTFVEGVLARVVVVYWDHDKEAITLLTQATDEVEIVGWEKLENLPSYNLREGVRNVLNACEDGNLLKKRSVSGREELTPLSVESLRKVASPIV